MKVLYSYKAIFSEVKSTAFGGATLARDD